MNDPDLEAIILRACDPRVGDRILRGHIIITEVTGTLPLDGIGHQAPDLDISISYNLNGTDSEQSSFLRLYQWMVRCAIECGETFHAVEDDEE